MLYQLVGSSYDFRQYKHRLEKHLYLLGIKNHKKVFLISTSNEGESLDDLKKQGHLLAKEISDFITNQNLHVDQISFVCHSLGGIVAR